MPGSQLLRADQGDPVALFRRLEVRAVLDDVACSRLRDAGGSEERYLRSAVVVVLDDVAIGQRPCRPLEREHADLVSARVKVSRSAAADRLESAVVVAENHHVAPLFVLEEERDPEVLGEPRDELEITLLVLNGGVSRRVGRAQPKLEILASRKAVPLQLLGDDLRHRQVEEDLGGMVERHPPRTRDERERVAKVGALGEQRIAERRDHAVNAAHGLIGAREDQLRRIGQDGFIIQAVGALGDDMNRELEELGDCLAAGQLMDGDVAGKCGGLDVDVDRIYHGMRLCRSSGTCGVFAQGVRNFARKTS